MNSILYAPLDISLFDLPNFTGKRSVDVGVNPLHIDTTKKLVPGVWGGKVKSIPNLPDDTHSSFESRIGSTILNSTLE